MRTTMLDHDRLATLARSAVAVAVLVVVGNAVVTWLAWDLPRPATDGSAETVLAAVLNQVDYGVTALLVAVLLLKRPHNVVSWVILAATVGFPLSEGAEAFARWASVSGAAPHPVVVGAAWTAQWSFWATSSALPFLLLLYPDGRLPSPRWRWFLWMMIGHAWLTLALLMFTPGRLEGFPDVSNPVGVSALPASDGASLPLSLEVALSSWLVFVVVALVSLVLRFRRAHGAQRQQLKVLVAAAVVLVVVVGPVFQVLPLAIAEVLEALANIGFAAAITLAILRYRLYEIDRIISRTATYAVVTVVLAAVYAVVAVVPSAVFELESDLLVAVATLAAAAAFGPVRRRVQSAVDRRFDRARYDAQQVVARFGAQLRDELDLAELEQDLGAVIGRTVQPTHVSVWLPDGGGR